jgi:hypothetical protein
MGKWANWDHGTQEEQDRALALCKGSYQRGIVLGNESISGSTLKGSAATYSGKYRASSAALISRLRMAGIPVIERREDHNKRILYFGRVPAMVNEMLSGSDTTMQEALG